MALKVGARSRNGWFNLIPGSMRKHQRPFFPSLGIHGEGLSNTYLRGGDQSDAAYGVKHTVTHTHKAAEAILTAFLFWGYNNPGT